MDTKSAQIRMKILGALIKDARLATGKSISDCASVIGITNERLRAFENGGKPPSVPELESLAFFMDVPLDHFWGQESRYKQRNEQISSANLKQYIIDRQKKVGELLQKSRVEAKLSLKELSDSANTTPRRLKTFEAGEKPIPIPELEQMVAYMDLRIEDFQDVESEVGKWTAQAKSIKQFLELPEEIQEFVTIPVNIPYLEIARNLSGLSVEKLRTLAEGILDITL